MDIVTLGLGTAATLTGFLLSGLATAEPVEAEDCTQVIAYDFTATSAPLYAVANQPGFWRHPSWTPVAPAFGLPEAGFPNLVSAQNTNIIGGELTYITDNTFANARFGTIATAAMDLVPLFDAYGATKIYVEVGHNFHAALYAAEATNSVVVHVLANSVFFDSFALLAADADGPPAGDIVFSLTYSTNASFYTTVEVATKPRAFADGLHTFRVEMTPSTPVVPGSTVNHNLNFDGVARVYIDDVLEFEDTAIRYRPDPEFHVQINDAFTVGGVGVGTGIGGGYTYLDFGYCEVVEEEPPIEPPNPGGELPEPIEPLTADFPLGISRIFALLTYGEGSPYSEIAVAEVDLNDPDSWYGGYKAPWLLGVSTIERELADSLRGVEVTVTVADPERVFRGLATTDTLSGAIMEIFLVSDTVRYALGEPFRRFAGRVHDHRALSGLRYEFVLRDVLSDELGRLADAPRIPPDRLTQTKFPGMTADYENRAVPIALGEVSDETETTPQGVVPPLIVAPSMSLSFFGGVDVQVVGAIVSHGAIPAYGFLQGYYNTGDNPYVRIPIPASAWGTILTAPGQAGWNYVGVATDYVDYPADPTLTHRYTPVFFLASDPNVQAVLDGRVQVAFNIYGLTENADGTGRYFSDAPDIYEFLIRNWLYPPHWRYGEYNGTPVLPRGYTIVNHDSVVLSRTRLRDFLGSPANYPVGFLLGRGGEQQTLRHVLTELCHGVLMEQGIDRHGRILLDVEDVDATATLTLSDLFDIETGEFEVWVDRASYRDTAEYVFGPRYLPAVAPLPTPPEGETLPPVNVGPHENWSAVATFTHTDAVTANQNLPSPPLILENYVVRNSDVASNWAERTINRLVGPGPSYDGQRLFRLTTSWQALAVELGDVIEIDHLEGMGASGYVGQRARVLKIIDDLQNHRIVIEGRVLFSEGSPS
jgi:hypothetical protein